MEKSAKHKYKSLFEQTALRISFLMCFFFFCYNTKLQKKGFAAVILDV